MLSLDPDLPFFKNPFPVLGIEPLSLRPFFEDSKRISSSLSESEWISLDPISSEIILEIDIEWFSEQKYQFCIQSFFLTYTWALHSMQRWSVHIYIWFYQEVFHGFLL